MSDHDARIERYIPKGENNYHYIAICSCGRWRSEPYRERATAERKATTHEQRGDAHLRARAANERGGSSLRSQHKWYVERAEDPFATEEERAMWQRLADEIRPRVQPITTDEDIPLF